MSDAIASSALAASWPLWRFLAGHLTMTSCARSKSTNTTSPKPQGLTLNRTARVKARSRGEAGARVCVCVCVCARGCARGTVSELAAAAAYAEPAVAAVYGGLCFSQSQSWRHPLPSSVRGCVGAGRGAESAMLVEL